MMSAPFFLYRYLLTFLFLLPVWAIGQNTIGLAEIKNYTREITRAQAQTWNIQEDRFGNLYFANNVGLLCFNGHEWKKYLLPNKTFLRSLAIARDDRIYVGGQDALGYFFPDENGLLVYHSLASLIPPADRAFADVWNIVTYENAVFFRSLHKIFRYDPLKGKMEVYNIREGSRWIYMAVYDQHLYAQDETTLKLFQYTQGQWKPAVIQPGHSIMAMYHYNKDTTLIASWKNGLFLMNSQKQIPLVIDSAIFKDQLYCIGRINANTYALGTVSNGIYFIDRNGHTIRHLSMHEGIQDNNIRTLFTDHESNLWAGLDEGIDMIYSASAIQKIKSDKLPSTSAYTIRILNNSLYIGSAEGLYYTQLSLPASEDISLSRGTFSLVPHSEGQTWDIDTINGMILMGHHDGVWSIQQHGASFINDNQKGVWQFRRLPKPGYLVAGTYEGLQLFRQRKGKLETVPLYHNFLNEPLRFIEIDDENNIVWASHPYRGIYQIKFSPQFDSVKSIRLFTNAEGLPGALGNYVFKINNHIVFATSQGIYEFDKHSQTFKTSVKYAPVFGKLPVQYMVSDATGKIWFASGDKFGVAEKRTIKYFPELQGLLVGGFEKIYPYNDNNIFIAAYRGIIHLNYNKYIEPDSNLSARLTKVVTHFKRDSLLFSDYFVYKGQLSETQYPANIHNLPAGYSAFHFEFASNQVRESAKVLYSYRLSGLDEEWSAWSTQNFKDYINLPYGNYRFELRAKDNRGNISLPVVYSFEILPLWYQTRWALLMYIILFVALILFLNRLHHNRLRIQKEKFEKEEAQLKYLHELEIKNNEQEIIHLKNERLETEVIYKNKELAATTMHLYKRGRLLGKIKDELSIATQKLPVKESRNDFKKVLKLISDEEKRENDWEQFAIHFDQVHNQFLSKMKLTYPDLTSTDLKTCAYLKMGLSSKEMAQFLNISLKGVEIARYRLRKKLGLSPGIHLTDFINQEATK